MPLIPLEDTFADVINKAQRGRKLTDEKLAAMAGVSTDDLAAIKAGKTIYAVIRRVARHLRLNPDALEAHAKRTWYPQVPVFQRGFAMFNTSHESCTVNSYLIWDSRTRQAAAFDTGTDCGGMLDLIETENLRLEYIFITHNHEDHVADLPRLAEKTRAAVFSHELEPLTLPGARTFKENAHFHLGTLAIKTLLTSGHSPGLTTYYITGLGLPLAVVGDSLFASSMGGAGELHDQLYQNIYDKILTLPRDCVLAAGHGPLTTLSQEKTHNPFFA